MKVTFSTVHNQLKKSYINSFNCQNDLYIYIYMYIIVTNKNGFFFMYMLLIILYTVENNLEFSKFQGHGLVLFEVILTGVEGQLFKHIS